MHPNDQKRNKIAYSSSARALIRQLAKLTFVNATWLCSQHRFNILCLTLYCSLAHDTNHAGISGK